MAPFEAPRSIPEKRKSDADEGPPRKRQSLGIGTLGVQTYWSVQWSVGKRPVLTRSDLVLRVNHPLGVIHKQKNIRRGRVME